MRLFFPKKIQILLISNYSGVFQENRFYTMSSGMSIYFLVMNCPGFVCECEFVSVIFA